MKPSLKNLLTIGLVAFVISSCGNKSADLLIPKDAALVIHINANSLGSKLSWNDIKNTEWFSMASREKTDEFEKKLLENPENSGIDLKSDMYFFMKPSGRNIYIAFQGKLKDAKAFEETIKKLHKDAEIKKDGNMSYAGQGLDFMTWTNDRFMMVAETAMQEGYKGAPKIELTKDSILNFAKATYSLKSNNSIGSNSNFKSVLNEKGDLHFWMSNDLFMRQYNQMGLSLFKASSVLEGNTTGFTVNFDNGKITGTSKTWYNKELGDLMKKYQAGNLNTDMLKKIPTGNVDAVIAMKYQPEAIKAFLKLLGIDGLADGYLNKAGFTLDDLINANKGDMLFAVSDISMNKETADMNSYGPSKPDAKILFATSINNKGAFDKLVDAGKNALSKIEGEGSSEVLSKIKYEVKDNWFVISNSQENVNAFGSAATDHAFINKISGHPFGAYIDLKKIIEGFGPDKMAAKYGMASADMSKILIWEDIVMYGGEIKDGAGTSYFEINLTDKNTNSLKQLFNFVSSMAKMFMGGFESMHDSDFPYGDSTAKPFPPAIADSAVKQNH